VIVQIDAISAQQKYDIRKRAQHGSIALGGFMQLLRCEASFRYIKVYSSHAGRKARFVNNDLADTANPPHSAIVHRHTKFRFVKTSIRNSSINRFFDCSPVIAMDPVE